MKDPAMFLGNSVETEQWESGNSNVAFPFADDSLPDGFPRDAIVDALVVVPSSLMPSTVTVKVGAVHIGPSMASAFILVGGRPALYCNVLKESYEAFSPRAMTSVMPGVSGMITFGNLDFGEKRTYRLDIPLSETAVIRPVVGRLEKFIQPEKGAETSGMVPFELPEGIEVSVVESGHVSTMNFTADESIRRLGPLPCSETDSPKTMVPPVRNINGVVPDRLGRIAVVFMHDEEEVRKAEELSKW